MNSLSPVRVFNERKDLRILFVFPWWGTETFAESEVKALRSLGAKVGVLVLRGVKGRSASSSEVNELPLFTLATFRNLISFLLSHPKIFASQLINLVKENLFNLRHLVRYLFVLLKAPSVAYLIKDRKF